MGRRGNKHTDQEKIDSLTQDTAMTKIVHIHDTARQRKDLETIRKKAREWIVQLDGTNPTEADLHVFRAWLRQDSRHLEEFRRIAKLWDELDALVFELVFPDDAREPEQAREIAAEKAQVSPRRFVFRYAVATLLIGLFTGLVFMLEETPDISYQANYVTAIGELKEVELPDGSGIRLNTNSKANVTYEKKARFVRLLEGEAFFDISHDPDKPFIVYAGEVIVQAMGTAFTVYLKNDGSVEVTVIDGKIKLSSLPQDIMQEEEPDLAHLEHTESFGTYVKGQQAILKDKIEVVAKLDIPQVEKELAWREGMLIFDNDPLEDVVREVSRYTPIKIVIVDAEIRDMKVGGFFPSGQTSIMLQTLENSFDIQVEEIDKDLVHLSSK